jgi:hypothetical protein
VRRQKPFSYRALQAVLKFLEAPLHHSLWLVAVVAAWIGFGGFVLLFATVGMMLDLGNQLLGIGFIIAFGVSAFWMVGSWLPK